MCPRCGALCPGLSDSPGTVMWDLRAVLQKRRVLDGKGLAAGAGHSPGQGSLGLLIGLCFQAL